MNHRLTLLIIVLFSCTILSGVNNNVYAAPKAVFSVDSAVYDFGKVLEGEVVTATFTITNKGDGDLTLLKFITLCGCISSLGDNVLIPPSEQKELTLTFNTAGFPGNEERGVRIVTNDPDNQSAMLSIKGTVEPKIKFQPEIVSTGNIFYGTEINPIKVLYSVNPSISVDKVDILNDSKVLDVSDIGQKGNEGSFSISFKYPVPTGYLRETVRVMINGDKEHLQHVPVIGYIQMPVQLNVNKIRFGTEDAGERKSTFTLKNLYKDKITIDKPSFRWLGYEYTDSFDFLEFVIADPEIRMKGSTTVTLTYLPDKLKARISENSDFKEGKLHNVKLLMNLAFNNGEVATEPVNIMINLK